MPKFLQKVTRHTKKKENLVYSSEQNKSAESITEATQSPDLLNKASKTTVYYMLYELKENLEKEIRK